MGQQREEQRAEHTALWGTCAQCGSVVVNLPIPPILSLTLPVSHLIGSKKVHYTFWYKYIVVKAT